MKVTWFGHSAFRVDYAGAAVMIDPFIRNPTFTGDPKAAWAGATHVVLSHGHNDHIGSTIEICKETGALLVANPEVCDFLEAKGVDNATPINHGGELAFDGFSVAYVPAWHSSSDDAADGTGQYLGNPGGVVLMAKGEKTLLHMGDTGIFSDMALIDEIYSPRSASCRSATASPWGQAGGDGLQALLPLRDGDPLPLRHVRPPRPERGQVHRRDEGCGDESAGAGAGEGSGNVKRANDRE